MYDTTIAEAIQKSFEVKKNRYVAKTTAKDSDVYTQMNFIPDYDEEELVIEQRSYVEGDMVRESSKVVPFTCNGITIAGTNPEEIEEYCRSIHLANATVRQEIIETAFLDVKRPVKAEG